MTKPIRLEHLADCAAWWGGPERKGRVENERAWKVTRRGDQGARLQPRHQEPAHRGGGPRRPRDAAGGPERRRGRGGGAPRPVEGDPVRGAGAMNAERLLALYERVAEAPDAIARLRRFVLDLAVRGKLVEQDPATNRRRSCYAEAFKSHTHARFALEPSPPSPPAPTRSSPSARPSSTSPSAANWWKQDPSDEPAPKPPQDDCRLLESASISNSTCASPKSARSTQKCICICFR
jgi:hypothetical protein